MDAALILTLWKRYGKILYAVYAIKAEAEETTSEWILSFLQTHSLFI